MHPKFFSIRTTGMVEIIDITQKVDSAVKESGVKDGLCFVFTPHSTACLSMNENDPDLMEDIKENLVRLVPIKGRYRHNAKYTGLPGEQNAHAHILSSIIKPYLVVPIINGSLKLGTWQSLFLIELDGPRSREIMVQVFR